MRKLQKPLIAIFAVLFIVSCRKDCVEPAEGLNPSPSGSFLTISQERYDEIKTILNKEFEQTQTANPIKDETGKTTEKQIVNTAINSGSSNLKLELAEKCNNITSKIPELKGFRSMLSVYSEALKIKDNQELKRFAEKYSSFLVYFEKFNFVMLSVPKYKAALLSADGIIKIEDRIVQYGETSIKIVMNGDASMIGELSTTNVSTDKIQVMARQSVLGKERKTWSSDVKYSPTSSLYAVGLLKFVDEEVYFPCSSCSVADWRYTVGCEGATFFNYAPTIVSQFGITTVNSYSSGTPVNGYGYVTNSGLVSSWAAFVQQHSLNPYFFSTTAYFNAKYVNGFVFAGVW